MSTTLPFLSKHCDTKKLKLIYFYGYVMSQDIILIM